MRLILLLGPALLVLLLFSLGWRAEPVSAAPLGQVSGIDLTVEIRVNPATPEVDEEVTVEFLVRNRGNVAAGAFTAYLYVNPADQPPDMDTEGRPFGLPGAPANTTLAPASRTETFDSIGCDHVIYVWVDRDEQVNDVDRSNNLVSLPLCVGVECEVDEFEADNSSQTAGSIAPGATQARSFCHPVEGEPAPGGDEDWIKFTAFSGLTYTLATSATANTAFHADPRIVVYAGTPDQAVGGPAPTVSWQPPVNGVYYAQIVNEEESDGLGPLTRYDLSLGVQSAVSDEFEPDDACGQAREIGTSGTAQSRLFQTPGDVDWVKFAVRAGESFAVDASNRGPGIDPVITLFESCQKARSLERAAQGNTRVELTSAEDTVYYAHLVNADTDRFGENATYDLTVVASACSPDDFENDGTRAQAKPLTLGPAQTRNACPAGDQDWVEFELDAGQVYVLKTGNLGAVADTVLSLYDDEGTKITENDDYNYVNASRIIFEPTTSGTYYAMVRHVSAVAAGNDTQYDLTLETGFCVPDDAEETAEDVVADNGPGDARSVPIDGTPMTRNFCADATARTLGDQDWMRFAASAGATYRIRTDELGPNADTVLRLYDRNGRTLLAENDDAGAGLAAQIVFTPSVTGDYFVQVTQYNPAVLGREASYALRIDETSPPPPPPTPTPPPPLPTPPAPDIDPSDVETLIVVNQALMATLHGEAEAVDILTKLGELAEHERVQGAILRLDQNPVVVAAYAAWTADDDSLADNDLANAVAEAIRNAILSFHAGAPELTYLVLVGDDRALPFLRVPEGNLLQKENEYVEDAVSLTIRAALAEDMILTDDFYATLEPDQRGGREIYLPDFAVGRLIQEPDEIMGIIDIFLDDPVIDTQNAFISGYDFVIDTATLNRTLLDNDGVEVESIIGAAWPRDVLTSAMLNGPPTANRYEWISINGHSTHLAMGVPNPADDDITAQEILDATNDFTRTLVYSVGCHAGLNDADVLDLPQAFARRGANFVGNTGFGWGGGGIVFSEALMRNFTRALAAGTSAEIGPSLSEAKRAYVSRARTFGGYDAKILMQTTLYGLPMFEITSGGTFDDGNLFPDVEESVTLPSAGAFSNDELVVGSFAFGVPGSFGAFGSSDAEDADPNYRVQLETARDGSMVYETGAPIQPAYFRDLTAPDAGSLRGVLFLGGVYTDTVAEAPLALAVNEYTDPNLEPPALEGDGWYPSVPFAVQSSAFAPGVRDTAVLALGQYDPATSTQRVFDSMDFETYYSDSDDRTLAEIGHVDAVLHDNAGTGAFKVEVSDISGIVRVVITFTEGQGQWESVDLTLEEATGKWIGTIAATTQTRYFVQAVDGSANVTVDDNKGRYYSLQAPLTLAQGRPLAEVLFVPMMISEEGD
ncbi:MAG: pre-peptidase C-terminal domain-containing protein [Litorilinea sp.]